MLIAEVTNSVGQILPSGNQVIHTNCFTDFDADIVCTYGKGGFECDMVIREQPTPPETFGIASDCRLQLLTEFFNTTNPYRTASYASSDGLTDASLEFGAMTMVPGRAFTVGEGFARPAKAAQEGGTRVYKSWARLADPKKVGRFRTFLIEEVPYQDIRPSVERLPAASAVSPRHGLSVTRFLPDVRAVHGPVTPTTIQMAQVDLTAKNGVALDYVMLNSSQTNYTFRRDGTF